MSAVTWTHCLIEADPDPLTIPPCPVTVPLPNREATEAVYAGPVRADILLGYIRHAETGDYVARTVGNWASASDLRKFSSRNKAVEWLCRSVNGIIPRKAHNARRTLAVATMLACLTAPALAQSPPPFPASPRSLPPPAAVLDAVAALRLACPGWSAGLAPSHESEAHVCALVTGHDTAWTDGWIAGSWTTAAGVGVMWLLLRLPIWLGDLLALLRRRRTSP
jgi:hypothetical protein